MTQAQASQREREFAFTDRDFKFLSALVHERTGIILAEHKRDMVYSRLARRLRKLGLSHFQEYCALLECDTEGAETGEFINAVTTNMTSFFRENHHFEHLENEVLAPMLRGRGRKPDRIRIWSSAASSGMEPYSIAMVLHKALTGSYGVDARILATDIDTQMLETGAQGHYPLDQLDKIPARYHYNVTANEQERTLTMSEELRRLLTFNQLNLLERWPMKGSFDVIFCRNVAIYFDKETQRKLFNRMADQLKPEGWLYIGHSENLFGVCDRFKSIGKTMYQRIG